MNESLLTVKHAKICRDELDNMIYVVKNKMMSQTLVWRSGAMLATIRSNSRKMGFYI